QFPYEDRYPDRALFKPLSYPLVKEIHIDREENEYWTSSYELPKLAAGFYLLEASQGNHIAFAPFLVSAVVLGVHESPKKALIFAHDVLKERPVQHAKVYMFDNKGGSKDKLKYITSKSFSGMTVWQKKEIGTAKTIYLLKAGNQYALSDMYYYTYGSTDSIRSVFITDRPVYRQGNLVQGKVILQDHRGGVNSPASGKWKLTLKAPGNTPLKTWEFKLDSFGTYAFRYTLPEEAPIGYYQLIASKGNIKKSGGFYVKQYRKPEFKVKVNPMQKYYVQGEDMEFAVQANYYSGEPLRGAKVYYEIRRRKIYFPWWWGFDFSWYYESDYDSYYSNYVADGTGETDQNGYFQIQFNPYQEDQNLKSDRDYIYTVIARVEGSNRRMVVGRSSVKYVRGSFRIMLSQSRWYYTPKQKVDVKVKLIRWEDGAAPVPTEVTLELEHIRYNWNLGKYEILETRQIGVQKTNANGETVFYIDPLKQGSYRARVSAHDENESEISEEMTWYIYSPYWEEPDHERSNISILPDKKTYKPGEKAIFSATLPYLNRRGKTPIYTFIENDDIQYAKIYYTKKKMAFLPVRLTMPMAPNFQIHAYQYYVKKTEKGIKWTVASGKYEVILPPSNLFLNVSLNPDRVRYKPGETGKLVVRVQDAKGNPVKADFSLAVVDEAIFAIQKPAFTDIRPELYPRKRYRIQNANSLNFRFYGYSQKVSLYSYLMHNRDRYLAELKGRKPPRVRKNFKDTALFKANGRTNRDGVAVIDIPFPDNLTEWRMTVHAITKDGKVGSKIEKVKVSKDFSIRVVMPRFVREKDKVLLGALLQNQYNQSVKTEVKVNLSGLTLEEAKNLSSFQVNLSPKSEKRIDFWAKASKVPEKGKAVILISGQNEIDGDAVQREIPVLPYGAEETIDKTWFFRGDQISGKIELPSKYRKDYNLLKVRATAGTLSAVVETLPFLVHYPYGCVEQTLSTFVPLMQAKRLAEKLHISLGYSKKEIEKIAQKGLKKLYGYQHSDGGWGWWTNDDSNAYMTAYVLWGFYLAKKANVKIKPDVIKRGLQYLYQSLQNEETSVYVKAFQGYVYSLYRPRTNSIVSRWQNILLQKEKNPYVMAFVALGSYNWKVKSIHKQAIRTLIKLAKQQGNGVYFEGKGRYSWHSDKEESTAFAIEALLTDNINHPILQKAVLWTMMAKRDGRWRSTKTSSMMINALAQYALKTGEKVNELGNIVVKVSSNGETLAEKTFSFSAKTQNESMIRIKNISQPVQIEAKRNFKGFALVQLSWKVYDGRSPIAGKSGIFSIQREYYVLRKGNDGEYYYSRNADDHFGVGDYVLVKTVLSPSQKGNYQYLFVEDFLPAGLVPLEEKDLIRVKGISRWDYELAARERLDDRIALSRTYLWDNAMETYTVMRATYPGTYHAMPARGGLMYYPETTARSSEETITILP
ncbi:MAG: hypothetical protein D6767_05355, partial [Candidatus Hydrogenedentota bacterium]